MTSQRTAVITGGTGGLGHAIAPLLTAAGFNLAVTYIVPEEAEALEQHLDVGEDRLFLRRVDCTDSEAVTAFMKETADKFGGIHVVVSLVGGWAGGRDIEVTDDVRFDRMVDLNLRSAFYTTRAAVPHLRRAGWGRIILVGSRAAFDTPAGQGAFNIAKAGVIALAKTLAEELSDSAITANAILPAIIDTPATRASLPYADYMDWPKPEEIATVVEFLASDASAVISGGAIPAFGNA
ncbi:MAG: SDR family oxidoreductase [Acidimicrobiia bacterium]|nr:SDR family oxidoreductase [Acidimicrobiia bacterium]